MAYIDSSILVNTNNFTERVKVAVVTSAILIAGEPIGAMTQAQTNKRQLLAANILSGGVNWNIWFYTIASNPTIAAGGVSGDPPVAGASDGDIQFTVNSVWDDMAGVTTTDLEI